MATSGRGLAPVGSSRPRRRSGVSCSRLGEQTITYGSDILSPVPKGKGNHCKRRADMCITCGGDEPEANHGNPKHITLQQLKDAAEAAELDITQLKKNIPEGLKRYAGAQ